MAWVGNGVVTTPTHKPNSTLHWFSLTGVFYGRSSA